MLRGEVSTGDLCIFCEEKGIKSEILEVDGVEGDTVTGRFRICPLCDWSEPVEKESLEAMLDDDSWMD